MQTCLCHSARPLCTSAAAPQRSQRLTIRAEAAPARPAGGASRASNPPSAGDARSNWGAAFETSARPSGAARDIFLGLPASAAAPGYSTPDPSMARPSGCNRSVSLNTNAAPPACPMSIPERPSGGSTRHAVFASATGGDDGSNGSDNGSGNGRSNGGGGSSGNAQPEGQAAVYGIAYAAVCGAAVMAHNSLMAPKPAMAKSCCGSGATKAAA